VRNLGTFTGINKKMKYLLLFIIAFFGVELYAQKCKCTSQQFEETEEEPTKVFKFKNGQELKLCSVATYNFKRDTTTYYKDFIIADCETQKPINLLENSEYFSISFNNDTLSIKEIIKLPVDKNRKFVMTAVSESKYYYMGNILSTTKQNIELPKYDTRQILATIKEYKNANSKIIDFKGLYARLLVAGLSDNSEALGYFTNFRKKFGDLMSSEEIDNYKLMQSIFSSIIAELLIQK
jgi:hypothetical protein